MGVLDDAIREHLELKRKHGAPDEDLARKEAEALGPARREMSAPAQSTDQEVPPGPPESEEPVPAESLDEGDREPPASADYPVDDERFGNDEVPATELLQEEDLRPSGALNGQGEQAGVDDPEDPGAARAYDDELAAEEELVADQGVMAESAAPGPVEVPLEDGAALEDESALSDDLEEDILLEEEPPHASGFVADDELGERETLEHELPEGEALPPAGERPSPDFESVEEGPLDAEDDDVLEDTPEFLEDSPEHDRLWFEQKPPRDFDFDD